MNHHPVRLWAFLCAYALVVVPRTLVAGGMTAKASLPTAAAAAQEWASDAVLVAISTLEANDDGTSDSWVYGFYSPSAKSHFSVSTTADGVETMEISLRFTVPVGDGFIDSDTAMAIAKKNGLKGDSPAMGLNELGPGSVIRWWVNGGAEAGDVSVVLDAKTGVFWRKEVID